MTIAGLTGGIATGKSAVGAMFAELGARVYSADVDARAVLTNGSPVLAHVFAAFPDAKSEGGTLDRARLATLVFGDADARRRLEAITHPPIIARMTNAITTARASAETGVLVYETPLLYEANLEGLFDVVVATFAPQTVQTARLQERERVAGREALTEIALADRFAAQLSVDEKARRADYVVRTNTSLEETRARVGEIYAALLARGSQ